jgi:hypothetical protein
MIMMQSRISFASVYLISGLVLVCGGGSTRALVLDLVLAMDSGPPEPLLWSGPSWRYERLGGPSVYRVRAAIFTRALPGGGYSDIRKL